MFLDLFPELFLLLSVVLLLLFILLFHLSNINLCRLLCRRDGVTVVDSLVVIIVG